jgi:hypothetical protein
VHASISVAHASDTIIRQSFRNLYKRQSTCILSYCTHDRPPNISCCCWPPPLTLSGNRTCAGGTPASRRQNTRLFHAHVSIHRFTLSAYTSAALCLLQFMFINSPLYAVFIFFFSLRKLTLTFPAKVVHKHRIADPSIFPTHTHTYPSYYCIEQLVITVQKFMHRIASVRSILQ